MACGSPRTLDHPELDQLTIAHLDCDAFFASVEKRDRPELADQPVIVGGGARGVVATCCYIARIKGVRSAMPMFEARRRCPEAVVIAPRPEAYREVSRAIRAMMEMLTPLVEPLSLDEAFLDLSGTARLHGAPPVVLMARLAAQIESELGVSASVGLSHNKFLAKLASDQDKPRGFSVIGRGETEHVLADLPVGRIWGVGRAMQARLAEDGIRHIRDLTAQGRDRLLRRYGAQGMRLWRLAHGEDSRAVSPERAEKSISAETTFAQDTSDAAFLDGVLWRLSVKVADRMKARGLSGRVVTLKLRRADFRILTRRMSLPEPTQLADRIYRSGELLLGRETASGPFRLLGIGLSDLSDGAAAQQLSAAFDPEEAARAAAERAVDDLRTRFGTDAITQGRGFRGDAE